MSVAVIESGRLTVPSDLSLDGGVQDPRRAAEKFIKKEWPKGEGPIVYKKYVSNNPMICDFMPDRSHPWVEQYTDVPTSIIDMAPRIFLETAFGERAINVGDGLIFTYWGEVSRQIGMLQGGEILSEEDAALREEINGRPIHRHTEWIFRIKEMVQTNGPELTELKTQSNEAQRASKRMISQKILSTFQILLPHFLQRPKTFRRPIETTCFR